MYTVEIWVGPILRGETSASTYDEAEAKVEGMIMAIRACTKNAIVQEGETMTNELRRVNYTFSNIPSQIIIKFA